MIRPRYPSLVALRAFEAVGRTGSVRAAGDELAVSHTVVSRHVQNLQVSLGVSLVRSEGRGVALTRTGRAFHSQISRAFDIIAYATTSVRGVSRPALTIWCVPGIATRRLLSRLPELTRAQDWEINLQPTLSHPDLLRDEADAQIVYADICDYRASATMSEVLIRPRVFPVTTPTYLRHHPEVTIPSELARSSLIHAESTERWRRWFELAGVSDVPALRGQRLWHAHLAIEAARLDQGIALANEVLVEDDLRSGALVEVSSTSIYMDAYQLIALKERWDDPSIVALRHWLKAMFACV